ncbi:MAG: ABC transporter permease [Gemmatimonadota bacterium]
MLFLLAFRHLFVRKARAIVLLLGYALGVGVMIVLLSVGEAMLEQSRDVALVGGGELTVLPQGIDIEAMRTGGVSGMFFTIDRARFLTRQLIGGPRQASHVAAVSPVIENKLLYFRRGNHLLTVRAGGEIPSRASAVGAGLKLRAGAWQDSPDDSAYVAPTSGQLFDELDHFHLPVNPDSSWGEWHYFNLVVAPDEWWYFTYLIGGRVGAGRWGGQVLVTHRTPAGRYERFTQSAPSERTAFDTTRADLTIGESTVRQRAGSYQLHALARGATGTVTIDVRLVPTPQRFFPPVKLQEGEYLSGYVVPALTATANGTICSRDRCTPIHDVPAYHDHNWGVWRDVTWDWGAARGASVSLLYGGVHTPDTVLTNGAPPFFVALIDSLGVRQILRAREIRYEGRQPASGAGGTAPDRFTFAATRDADTLRVRVHVEDALATVMGTGGFQRNFLQMRGHFVAEGTVGGRMVSDSGSGFFETYVRP